MPELVAIRRVLPDYRDVPVTLLREKLGSSGSLELSETTWGEARELTIAARNEGLSVDFDDRSEIGYVAFDLDTGMPMSLIYDAKTLAIVKSMIAAGVPVRDIEIG